jgi:CheY-like chemotaxis protein
LWTSTAFEICFKDKGRSMASILVVDDEASITKGVERSLTTEGHQVLCATNGKEALKIIASQTIDLVIADILMPEMDGYELILKLRKQPNPPKIIAISGGSYKQNGKELLHAAKVMKADKVLPKPFDSTSINAAVIEVLGAVSTT